MKPLMAMALATGLLAASPAMAENALSKADPAKAQQIVNTVCIACHGADGNSVSSANPKLAGQHSEYLLKQLQNFKSGERKNPIMSGMVATLTPEDMQNLAAYFSSQKTAPGQAKDPALLAMGEKLYRGGNTNSGVAACAGCHSPNGAGIPALFPRLAGQHADYVVAQLKAFRTSERANDPGKMMQTIAVKMTEKEMTAVAEYITALH
ncbi:MAG: c-type cytochrome [Burkholderiales bacterium]